MPRSHHASPFGLQNACSAHPLLVSCKSGSLAASLMIKSWGRGAQWPGQERCPRQTKPSLWRQQVQNSCQTAENNRGWKHNYVLPPQRLNLKEKEGSWSLKANAGGHFFFLFPFAFSNGQEVIERDKGRCTSYLGLEDCWTNTPIFPFQFTAIPKVLR